MHDGDDDDKLLENSQRRRRRRHCEKANLPDDDDDDELTSLLVRVGMQYTHQGAAAADKNCNARQHTEEAKNESPAAAATTHVKMNGRARARWMMLPLLLLIRTSGQSR